MKNQRSLFAIILILVGLILYLGNFIPIFQLKFFWPAILIIVGLGIMFRELS